MHEHDGGASWIVAVLPVLLALFLAVAYVAAAFRNRRRRPWPAYRSVLFVGGLAAAGAAVAGPLAATGHAGFEAHMVAHLLLGMLAPLLLVLAAPATLALRSMDVVPARRLSALLRSPPARFLVHPVPATVLNVGGLWALYTTDLYPAMHANPLLLLAVHAHVFIAGYLFTASMIGIDPAPHRPGHAYRSVVMVVALAAHDILAKHLHANPPEGVPAGQAETGTVLMYYGGDAIDLVLITILCAQWYRVTRPRAAAARGAGRLEPCP